MKNEVMDNMEYLMQELHRESVSYTHLDMTFTVALTVGSVKGAQVLTSKALGL